MAPPLRPGTASAHPGRLTAYSDACTRAAQDLQSWLSGVLAPALSAYLHGAAARNEGANIDMSAVQRLAGVVKDQLPRHIATMYYTDRDVRRVGRLFEEAGSHGSMVVPGSPPLPTGPFQSVVHTTDAELDRMNLQEGAELAAQVPNYRKVGELWSAIMSTLAQQADDPLFCAGFYNALNEDQVWSLLVPWTPVTAQALATALASGSLSPKAYAGITPILEQHGPPQVLEAVAANPQGAANFIRFLMKTPDGLRLFLHRGVPPDTAGFFDDEDATTWLRGAFRLLAAGESVMNPKEVQGLIGAVAAALPKGMSVKNAKGFEKELRFFLVTATIHLLGPLPKPKPGEPPLVSAQEWAEDYGTALRGLLPYEQWLKGIYQDGQQAAAHMHAWVENIVLGAAGGVLTGGVDEPIVALAANGIYGGAAGEIQSRLDQLLGWGVGPGGPPADLDPEDYLHKAATLALVAAVYRKGLGYGSLQRVLREEGLQQLLSSLEQGHGPGGPGQQWARNQRLRLGDDARLEMLIDALESHFK
ncbi:hypothetical protein [Streptomyces puniciscabiei]|uniref:hypothetical protein n=1 Tax=Streptomyces puniciscabiei TaxID=164348 RepID=UPI00331CA3C2